MKIKNDIWLKNSIDKMDLKNSTYSEIIEFTTKLYEKGYSGLDLIDYIEQNKEIDPIIKSHLLITFHKVKRDFMNEKLFILYIITFIRSDDNLENISFM
jgi:hypothetical protein